MPARYKTLTSTFAALAAATVLAGCGGAETPAGAPAPTGGAEGAPDVELVAEGKITTCTALPYEPFQFQEGGKIVGFDVDMIDLVAKKLGVTQEIVDTPFDTSIQTGEAMNIGQCDVAAAAMTINDERKQNFDFSDPYFDATQALLTKTDSGITDAGQLAGKTVGVQTGTTGALWAEDNATGATLVTFDDLGLLTAAALTGQVQAVINDNVPLRDFAAKNPGLAVTTEFDTGEQYGFGVRKGNTALLDVINETITEAKADGTYDATYEKWVGVKPS